MRSLCLLLLLTAALVDVAGADKITADPNAPGAATPKQDLRKADQRLSQKVTCEPGYTRLHNVAEDLNKLTGVGIRAGRNAKDWQVRDIPLVVCARDIPLGKLLRAVADAAHVQLRAERIGSGEDDKPGYRFFRTSSTTEAISSVLDARAQANLAVAEWVWDTLVAYAGLSDAEADRAASKFGHPGISLEATKLVSKLLASLGPDARAKALSGEYITLKIAAAPQPDLLRKLYDCGCRTLAARPPRAPYMTIMEPTEREVADSRCEIRVERRERAHSGPGFYLLVRGIPMLVQNDDNESRCSDNWYVRPVAMARTLATAKELKIPKPPEADSVLGQEDTFPNTAFKPLKTAEDWDLPLLQAKVKVKLPEDNNQPTKADVLPLFSKAADLNIVCEDFESHKLPLWSRAGAVPGSETTAANILATLDPISSHATQWFVDEDTKLLVGWDGWCWRRKHLSLVPESMLSNIRLKRETDGAELDDVVPLVDLRKDQYDGWIRWTQEFGIFQIVMTCAERPIWQIYSALSSADKGRAVSDAGLPLAKFDPHWLVAFYQQALKESRQARTFGEGLESDPNRRQILRVFSDPDLVSTLVMRVRRRPLSSWPVRTIADMGSSSFETYYPPLNRVKKHGYVIELEGRSNGEDLRMTAEWYEMAFPIYTPQREAELRKKAAAASKDKK